MKERSRRGPRRGSRRVRLRFFTSPVEIMAKQGRVGSIRLERNRVVRDEQGHSRCLGTGVFEQLEVGLVFRSVGYRGVPLPDVPFDERKGVIPNAAGRVLRPPGEETGTGRVRGGLDQAGAFRSDWHQQAGLGGNGPRDDGGSPGPGGQARSGGRS